jgi:hypothetical protein
MLVRRDVMLEVAGFQADASKCGMFEDQISSGYIALKYPIFYDHEPVAIYRQHDASSVSAAARTGQLIEFERQYLAWLLAYLDSAAVPAASRIRAVALRRLYFCLCREARRLPAETVRGLPFLRRRLRLLSRVRSTRRAQPRVSLWWPWVLLAADVALPIGTSYALSRVVNELRCTHKARGRLASH